MVITVSHRHGIQTFPLNSFHFVSFHFIGTICSIINKIIKKRDAKIFVLQLLLIFNGTYLNNPHSVLDEMLVYVKAYVTMDYVKASGKVKIHLARLLTQMKVHS